MSRLKIGDWVTQYRKGFWQVIDIKPKYADEDYKGEQATWKKGDLIGEWCIMKKAFTPKMKFTIDGDCCDIMWCEKVSESDENDIKSYFEQHPSDWNKFVKSPLDIKPVVCNIWINMDEENANRVEVITKDLPDSFTRQQLFDIFSEKAVEYRLDKPPVTYLLNLFFYYYEIDSHGEIYYHSAKLLKNS